MKVQLTQEQILAKLPHGSGIDCDWSTSENRNYWCFHNSFHAMNDNGMYDGYADFTLKVPKKSDDIIKDFKLEFNGSQSQQLQRKYMLREYLEDTFACALRSDEEPQPISIGS